MIIDGFGISGYRSFNDEFEYINDLSKVNIFIGKNNSGKSNILRFWNYLSQMDYANPYKEFDKDIDFCKEATEKDVKFAMQIKRGSTATGKIYEQISEILPNMAGIFPEWKDNIWFKFSFNQLSKGIKAAKEGISELAEKIQNNYNGNVTEQIANRYLNYKGTDHHLRSIEIANKIYNFLKVHYKTKYIGAFRQITNESSNGDSINGSGLIEKLKTIQAPSLDVYRESKEKFDLINNFLRELINENDAFIDIPKKMDEIYVSIKSKILPLQSLGAGIHELIILAAAVTIEDDTIFCIEEPEIHIHPSLQKKFIHYILEKTENQYLITTHSNAFLDIPQINIYHCKLIDKNTKCNLVSSNFDKYGILSDLGYKPSDMLQSNFIVWVEGPSDRIYINHWIHEKSPSLLENFHYSIMFYGGRLLSHLTYDSPEIDEFIQLSKINHNAAIVIDSDKSSSHSRLNETKKRIIENFEDNNCFVWVTKGREIENYIPEALINETIHKIHPKKAVSTKWGIFENMTTLKNGFSIDKISIAKYLSSSKAEFSILNLEKQINNLIKRIEKANGLIEED